MKKISFLAVVTALIAVIIPHVIFAAKPVSQSFPNAQLLYLPLNKTHAYVLVDSIFYTTEFPGMPGAQWYPTDTPFSLESNRAYKVIDHLSVGVRLNGYTYFILQTANTPTPDTLEIDFDRVEVWRMRQTTGVVERVADWNSYTEDAAGTKTYFEPVRLVKFNHHLYLLNSNGMIQHSSDGMKWYESDTSDVVKNIPEDTFVIYHMIASPAGLYLTVGGFGENPKIYHSTDSMTWTELTHVPFTDKTGNVESLTVSKGVVYTIVSNMDGSEYQLWKYDGSNWMNVLTSTQQLRTINHTAGALYLVQYNLTKTQTKIRKSVDAGEHFTTVYETNNDVKSIVDDAFIKNLAKPTFIVRQMQNNGTTYLLRIK